KSAVLRAGAVLDVNVLTDPVGPCDLSTLHSGPCPKSGGTHMARSPPPSCREGRREHKRARRREARILVHPPARPLLCPTPRARGFPLCSAGHRGSAQHARTTATRVRRLLCRLRGRRYGPPRTSLSP